MTELLLTMAVSVACVLVYVIGFVIGWRIGMLVVERPRTSCLAFGHVSDSEDHWLRDDTGHALALLHRCRRCSEFYVSMDDARYARAA